MNIIIFALLASLFVCIGIVARFIDKLEYRVGQLESEEKRKFTVRKPQKINNMQERKITITLDKAKEWYNRGNASLMEAALQAFTIEELYSPSFKDIVCFDDAYKAIGYSAAYKVELEEMFRRMALSSRASVAMFKLNLIRRALNQGYNMHLTKNADGQKYTWSPYFRFVTKDSTCYDNELKSGEYKKLGSFISKGITYDVLGGHVGKGGGAGLGGYHSGSDASAAYVDIGFLGCATKEIAKHFGLHFGMLILEAMYGDMIDFRIVE